MSITRAQVEQVLVARLGPLMSKAGMAVTYAGANADLNDPIGWALRRSGYTVASLIAVADSDLSGVATADTDKILDLAELRTLLSILTNLDDVDVRVLDREEKLSQLVERVERKKENLEKRIKEDYGIGAAKISVGVLDLDFAEHGEDTATWSSS